MVPRLYYYVGYYKLEVEVSVCKVALEVINDEIIT